MRIFRSKAAWAVFVVMVGFVLQVVWANAKAITEARAAENARLVEEQGDKPVDLLRAGDCFEVPEAEGERANVRSQTCSAAHEAEVIARFEIEDGAYPGDDELRTEALLGCAVEFEKFTGHPYDHEASFRIFLFRPTADSWIEENDHVVTCAVVDPTGPTEGSLRSPTTLLRS